MNDSELLSAYLLDGSEKAFATLVNRHMKLVFSAALRQVGGNTHLAKDVAQQVFSALARKAGALRHHPTLSGWLYTSTHHAAAAAVRAEQRRRASEQAAHLLDENPSFGVPDIWERIRPVLDRAMNELNARDRQALLLRYFEDRPFAEVGERLALSENAARMRVARALDKMHALLARQGVASTTAALALALTQYSAAAVVPAGLAAEISGAALAGAAGALGLAQVMAAAKMSAGVMGLLLIGFGLYQFQAASATDAAVAIALRQYHAEQDRLQALEGRIRSGEPSRAALNRVVAAQRASPPPDPAIPPAAPARDPKVDGQAFLAAFPEQRAALIAIGKAQISSSFSPFYRRAGLSSAQIAEFENFVAETWTQNLVATPEAIYPDLRQFPEDQLHALLGDEAYRYYETYVRGEGAYALARQIATALAASDVPALSVAQADQLAQIVLSQNSAYQNGGAFRAEAVNWDGVMMQIQGLLTSPQLKVAEGVFLDLQYRIALSALRTPHPSAMRPSTAKAETP